VKRALAVLVGTLIAGTFGAALITPEQTAGRVRLRALSATDVLAIPFRGNGAVAPRRVVVLGDSVATGAGCGCAPFGPRLARLLTLKSGRPTHLSTLARDGVTTKDLLAQVTQDPRTLEALRYATDVVVTIGANDFDASEAAAGCAGTGTSCFDADLAGLPRLLADVLTQIRSDAVPRVTITLTGYWNVFLDGRVGAAEGRTYQSTSDALTRLVNAAIRSAADWSGAAYVDLYAAFRGDGDRDDTALLAPDGDHPSSSGQQRIAAVLALRLAAKAPGQRSTAGWFF
jgi:lysophospholipase L1-like esterase